MTRKRAAVRRLGARGKSKATARRTKTRAERNIDWIERHCRIPEGKYVGQPVKLRAFQRKILRKIYDSPTRHAIISFGRKNAKTALAAMLLVLHVAGPEARANSQLYSDAQSREQAAILFSLAAKIVRMSPDVAAYVTIRDTAKELVCEELGTKYRALSAEASTAYGLSPVFIVHDELGQVRGPRSELYEALETATAAQEDPLSIVISTQASTDADLLSILIDDAKTKADPLTKLVLYEADREADPFAEETIRQANPAFGDFQNAAEVLAMAEAARRMPSREAQYRNLVLNQRVEASSPFVTTSVWGSNGDEPDLEWAEIGAYGALDLSDTTDLTACVFIAQKEGRWHVRPIFWLPAEGIADRARNDRVPYDKWAEQGFLRLTQGRSVSYEHVARELVALMSEIETIKIGFDRWNMRHFKPWLIHAGLDEETIAARFIEFGQGYQSMSPAIRTLEEWLINEQLAHGRHPVLAMCANNAVVKRDEAGNRKLDKKRSTGRIDGLVALVMAAGVASVEAQTDSIGYVSDELVIL